MPHKQTPDPLAGVRALNWAMDRINRVFEEQQRFSICNYASEEDYLRTNELDPQTERRIECEMDDSDMLIPANLTRRQEREMELFRRWQRGERSYL